MAHSPAFRVSVLSGHFPPPADDSREAVERCNTAANGITSRPPEFPDADNMRLFPPAVHDSLMLEDLLSPDEKRIRDDVRKFMQTHVAPVISDYWERAEFPHHLVKPLSALNLGGGTLQGHGCPGLSVMGMAMAVVEMSRVDGSMSTFLMVHNCLAMATIGLLGSEAQKARWLPRMASLDCIGSWGLTEPSNGSDASALLTTAQRVAGGWKLNGRKRWIGNATFADICVVWARNTESNQVNAFIVTKGTPGYTTTKMQNKIALRCVQNADIHLDNVFVPDDARLPGVNSFQDTNKVLATSRIMVAWQPIGLAMGAYDMCVRYTQQRRQFGAPLAAFQLTQERLARMQATIHASFLLAWRLSMLHQQGQMTHAMASSVKAWTTARAREVLSLAREMLGGNGVLSEFLVAKAFCDLEAYYTYEGTYDVNALVAARDITGLAAFKVPKRH